MFFLGLKREQGSSLLRPALQRVEALEQDRRRRIQQPELQENPQ